MESLTENVNTFVIIILNNKSVAAVSQFNTFIIKTRVLPEAISCILEGPLKFTSLCPLGYGDINL